MLTDLFESLVKVNDKNKRVRAIVVRMYYYYVCYLHGTSLHFSNCTVVITIESNINSKTNAFFSLGWTRKIDVSMRQVLRKPLFPLIGLEPPALHHGKSRIRSIHVASCSSLWALDLDHFRSNTTWHRRPWMKAVDCGFFLPYRISSLNFPAFYFSTACKEHEYAVNSTARKDVQDLHRQLAPDDLFMIERLMEYREISGDCHVPTGQSAHAKIERQEMAVSDELASWVVKQRSLHRRYNGTGSNSKTHEMSNSLATKFLVLESIGFMWSCREAQWQRNFNRLERYGRENGGNTRVSQHENLQLFNWSSQQRKAFLAGRLPQEREDLLREINFVFDCNEAEWLNHYEKLCLYKERNGDTLVPTSSKEHRTLATWVTRQRHLYKIRRLEVHRIKALNDVGFVWDVQKIAWNMYYAELLDFFEKHGHTRVPRSAGSLWGWTDRQRKALKQLAADSRKYQDKDNIDTNCNQDRLDDVSAQKLLELCMDEELGPLTGGTGRTKRLLDLPFEVALHDESWMQSYQELCAFKDKNGHLSVPGKQQALSNWVRHQRYRYNREMLSQSRIALLESIGFAW